MKKHKRMNRALVTGGAGFIGSHLCEELLARHFQVVVIDNFSTGSYANVAHLVKAKKIKVIKGSILNEKLMERLVKRCDIVFHLAAAVGVQFILEHPISSLLTNIDGTEIVLKLADKHYKKVVLASTSEVYGNQACYPIKENDNRVLGSTTVSRWSYSDAKAIDEFLALAYAHERKLPIVIVRFFNTVGPRQVGRYGMVLPRFIKAALLGKPITVYGDGSQIRSFCYVKDVVGALVALSLNKKAEGEIYNLGNHQAITIKQLALLVKCLLGSESKVKYVSYKKAYGKEAANFEDIECRIPDISKIKKMIKFKPRYDIEGIIKKTAAYFLRQGDIKHV